MTENEAIELGKNLYENLTNNANNIIPTKKYIEFVRMAIKSLEEIQEYRAIGTVEEFKALSSASELWEHNNHLAYRQGRKDVIDEFSEALRLKCLDNVYREVGIHSILKITEQMKGEEYGNK